MLYTLEAYYYIFGVNHDRIHPPPPPLLIMLPTSLHAVTIPKSVPTDNDDGFVVDKGNKEQNISNPTEDREGMDDDDPVQSASDHDDNDGKSTCIRRCVDGQPYSN